MLVKIRGKRKSSETFSVVGEELKFFCANEPVPCSRGGREPRRLCTYPGKKPRKEFLWDKRLYGEEKKEEEEEDCRGSDGSRTPTGRRGGGRGVGNWRDIPGKMIIRSWKNFWHEKKEKVASVGTLPPQCHGYRVIYRQIVDGGSVSSNRNYRFGHPARNYGANRFLFLAFTSFKRCFDEGRNSVGENIEREGIFFVVVLKREPVYRKFLSNKLF